MALAGGRSRVRSRTPPPRSSARTVVIAWGLYQGRGQGERGVRASGVARRLISRRVFPLAGVGIVEEPPVAARQLPRAVVWVVTSGGSWGRIFPLAGIGVVRKRPVVGSQLPCTVVWIVTSCRSWRSIGPCPTIGIVLAFPGSTSLLPFTAVWVVFCRGHLTQTIAQRGKNVKAR